LDLSDFIDRFRGPLIGLIASWGANYNDASEIAQDSFADAYLNRGSCRGDWQDPEVFGAWLRGIAMVTLVTRLGRAGLIDRSTVGGTLITSLLGLMQVT